MIRNIFLIVVSTILASTLFSLPYSARALEPAAQRQESEKAAEQKLNELDKNMDQLAAKSRKEGQPRTEINRLYDEFKKSQPGAQKDLEDLRKATNETWDKVKVRMDKAIADLNGLYERAKAKHKTNEESPDKSK